MSGYTTNAVANHAPELARARYVEKPIATMTPLRMLRSVLDEAASKAAS